MITVTDPQKVARMLAITIETVAYSTARDNESYCLGMESSLFRITDRKGKPLQDLINTTVETPEAASTPSSAPASSSTLPLKPNSDEAAIISPMMILGREPTHFEGASPSSSTAGRVQSETTGPLGNNQAYNPSYPALDDWMQK
jgi:hypothetical protein